MATSGSYDFTITAEQIVTDALYKVGAAEEGESLPPEQISTGLRQLNRLVKFIAAKEGRHLWRRDEVILFLNSSQTLYLLGPETTDAEWCMEEDFVETKLNGAAASGATSLTVDSTTGMTASDRFGLELSDGTREWAAITSVDSSTTLTVPAIGGAASDNATLYTYTTRPQRPLRVLHARRRSSGDGSWVPIDVEAQELFRDQPTRSTDGTPVFLVYKPTLTSGRLEIWQSPSDVKMYLGLTVERPFEDIDLSTNNPDFPVEWFDPLVYLLAERIEPEYRTLDAVRLQLLSKKAEEMWEFVNTFDDDMGSIYFQPERRR